MNDQAARKERLTPEGHRHAEAFCLMWYACEKSGGIQYLVGEGANARRMRTPVRQGCGHRERYWNSRDGVTPFGAVCPSCGEPTLQHVDFRLDQYAPNHKPHLGQRVWIDMTLDAATKSADERIAFAKAQGSIGDDYPRQQLIDSIYNEGKAPDMAITGYAEK